MSRVAEDLTSVEGHVVQFYERDDDLVSAVTRFAGAGLADGEGVLVVATAPHRAAFEAALRAEGHDLTDGYVALDAAETLRLLLGDDGRIDASRFFDVAGRAIRQAATGRDRVRVFGEIVALLSADGAPDEAMVLEGLWNDLARGPARFALLCAYPAPNLADADELARFYDACTHHAGVVESPDAPLAAWRSFDPTPTAIGAARRFVAATVHRWGFDDVLDDAAVVVSELATNAVLHARSPFHVSVTVVGDGLRVAVHDRSPAPPTPRDHSLASATGRGLRMVDALASRWGTVPLPDRKAVWAELAEPQP